MGKSSTGVYIMRAIRTIQERILLLSRRLALSTVVVQALSTPSPVSCEFQVAIVALGIVSRGLACRGAAE